MKAKKTIKAKIIGLRKGKEELLKREYENWQRYLHGDRSAQLYSATKQQADRLLRRLKGKFDPNKEYPMILRRDVYRANTKLTPYWLKIPIHGVRGGINVPIKTYTPLTEGMAKYGITPKKTYEVSIPDPRKLAKEMGINHENEK